jgi:hypothetical protein
MEAEVDMVASVLATRLDDQGLRLFTRGDGTAPLRATAPGSPQAILASRARSACIRTWPRSLS